MSSYTSLSNSVIQLTVITDSNSIPSSRSVIHSEPLLNVNVYRYFGLEISRCYGDLQPFITHNSKLHSFLRSLFWARCLMLVTYRYWISVEWLSGLWNYTYLFTFYQTGNVLLSCCTRFFEPCTVYRETWHKDSRPTETVSCALPCETVCQMMINRRIFCAISL